MLQNRKVHFWMSTVIIIWFLLTGCSQGITEKMDTPPMVKTKTVSISDENTTGTASANTQSWNTVIEKPKDSIKESDASVRSKIEQSTTKAETAKDAFLALWKSLSVDDNKDELIKVLEAEAKVPDKTNPWDSEYDSPEAMRAPQDPLDAIYVFFRSGNGRQLQEGLLTILRDGIRVDKCSQNGSTWRTFLCRWDDTEITTVQKFLQNPMFIRPWYAPKQYKNSNSGVTVLIEFASGATIITMPR